MTITTAEAAAPETVETLPDLTGHDRCDNGGCNAAAYVRVRVSTGDLVFCGHHYARHESAVVAAGAQIRDERSRLWSSYLDIEATELR